MSRYVYAANTACLLLVFIKNEIRKYVCSSYTDPFTEYGDCSHGDVRLANYTDNEEMGTREGRIEICINNAWGTVCVGIGQVIQHQPCTFENLNFNFHYAFHIIILHLRTFRQ